MKEEAELHAEEDKKQREMIELRNVTDNLIYLAEKTLKDSGDKISDEDKKSIEEKVEELKKIKDGDNMDEIKQKSEELSQIIQKIGTAMYQESPEEAKKEGTPEEDKPEEGEFKEKE